MTHLLEYDFRELQDGDPLPEDIGFGILRDGVGPSSILDEVVPSAHFYANRQPEDTFATALFDYTTTSAPGGQVDHHGLICSPGFLPGSNADIGVQFINPLKFFQSGLDEFHFQIAVGFRGAQKIVAWVGGMLLTHWTVGGGWDPKMELSVVRVDSSGITKMGSQAVESIYLDINELTVRVKHDQVIAGFNGIVFKTQTGSQFRGGSQTVLYVKAYTKTGATVAAIPTVTEYLATSLRSGRFQPIKEIPGNYFLPPITGDHFYKIPIQELEAEGKLKQIAPSQWQFTQDTLVIVDEAVELKATKDAVIISYQHILDHASYHWCKVRYL